MQDTSKDLRRKILGRKGEDAAVKFLKKRRYKILKRNYKTPFGEADIVAKQGDVYCFVEVKTRTTDDKGLPAEAVDFKKQQRYRRIALYFSEKSGKELPCRFDVVSILDGEIELFENAY